MTRQPDQVLASVFDPRPCALGEGPLWHPEREQLFWFDILEGKLLSVAGGDPLEWDFDEMVSAAGWIDRDTLLVASATGLWRYSLADDTQEFVVALEADNPATRSNDGRADPQGGFWIGTMALDAAPRAGAIYRWYRGELRKLYPDITVPNAICFAPDGRHAFFTDTPTGIVQRVALDAEGWPAGSPDPWLDLREDGHKPDGAVIDAAGNLWVSQWGSGRIACHAPDGALLTALMVPVPHTTCPAFGGSDLATLFCTTARQGLEQDALAKAPLSGQTFALVPGVTGRPEPRVIL